MIPSVFAYKGLKYPGGQKYNNYDQFLRSNIDNEQDNRNFNDESGRDHLPFRTLETTVDQSYRHNRYDGATGGQKDLRLTVHPGDSVLLPLRWNNPHSAEMEVNVWIFDHGGKKGTDSRPHPIVIPIRKPTCSGEGHQDNSINFQIPKDFGHLGKKIPGFKGCTRASRPMCTLQVYSHSVESRQYALGFPISIPGNVMLLQSNGTEEEVTGGGIRAESKDPWLDISSLRDTCRSAADSDVHIENAEPRWARMVSDVYTHSYMNSDYSPYSGQQFEYISKNLQSSAINKMVTGNRGELGKSILTQEAATRIAQLQSLEDSIYKNYEALANRIIKTVGRQMENTGTLLGTGVKQQTSTCFRCAEVGALTARRLDTNTYIPSFQLPDNLVATARRIAGSKYSGLINSGGMVKIYEASLLDLMPFFFVSHPLGVIYQEAKLKDTLRTHEDEVYFKKRTATKGKDKGQYAATQAKKKFAAMLDCPEECLWCDSGYKPLINGAKATCVSGKCVECTALFDNYAKKSPPAVTELAKMVAKRGLPGAPMGDNGRPIPSYPDPDGSPRVGRPPGTGQGIVLPKNTTWDLGKQPPAPPPPATSTTVTTTAWATTTTVAPTPPPQMDVRRRSGNRRRRNLKRKPTRRRSPKRRRSTRRRSSRRRTKSRRRAAKASQADAEMALLHSSFAATLEEVLGDVERLPLADDCGK
jgi:hypothetical protein